MKIPRKYRWALRAAWWLIKIVIRLIKKFWPKK
jgi:hypothetical protein